MEKTFNTLTNQEIETLKRIHERALSSSLRENFHVEPLCGTLGAPIAIEKVSDEYHIYYLWKPMADQSEGNIWYEVKTADFIHYENVGIALESNLLYDNYGCEGGCLYEESVNSYFFYVGRHKDYEKQEKSYLLIAKKDSQGNLKKGKKPIFEEDIHHLTSNPEVIKIGDRYYIFVGSEKGKIIVYESNQLFDAWKRRGELKVVGLTHFGNKIDTLSIEKVGEEYVLLVSYQLEDESHCSYLIGSFNPQTLELNTNSEIQEVDLGYDFYDGRLSKIENTYYLLGSLHKPERRIVETQNDGYEGELALVRKCEIKDGKLLITPAGNINLVEEEVVFKIDDEGIHKDMVHGRIPETCLLHLNNKEKESFEFNLFALQKKNGLTVKYSKYTKEFILDTHDLSCTKDFPIKMKTMEKEVEDLVILVDKSSVEIYVDKTDVYSLRVFPEESEHMLRMIAKGMELLISTTKKVNKDEFII